MNPRTKPSKIECHRRPTYQYRSTQKGSLKTLVRSEVCGDQQKCLYERPPGSSGGGCGEGRRAGGSGNGVGDGTGSREACRRRWGRWSAGSGEGGDRPAAAWAVAGRQPRGRPPAHGGSRPSQLAVAATKDSQPWHRWRWRGRIQPVMARVAANRPWRGGRRPSGGSGGSHQPAAAAEAEAAGWQQIEGGGEGTTEPAAAVAAAGERWAAGGGDGSRGRGAAASRRRRVRRPAGGGGGGSAGGAAASRRW
ncbi:hypothetical protein I4F81_006710 [Pyropia yezoensis]|uniref:Uncharacterized protein n=1 Tax=Pyropia yezoensis TaxID=2788 RepID=A0ACC3C205_PYRYE|nr:hypothetical protein I4F81_006710 [Neopyropia yezoensis]